MYFQSISTLLCWGPHNWFVPANQLVQLFCLQWIKNIRRDWINFRGRVDPRGNWDGCSRNIQKPLRTNDLHHPYIEMLLYLEGMIGWSSQFTLDWFACFAFYSTWWMHINTVFFFNGVAVRCCLTWSMLITPWQVMRRSWKCFRSGSTWMFLPLPWRPRRFFGAREHMLLHLLFQMGQRTWQPVKL